MTASPSSPLSTGRTQDLTSYALARRLTGDYLRPHVAALGLAAFCMILVSVATAANAWLMEPALNRVFVAHDRTMLWLVPLAVIAIAVIKGFASFGQSMLVNHVGQKIIAEIQTKLFTHLVYADVGWLQASHSSALVSSLIYDVTLLRDAIARAATGMVKDMLTVICLGAVMFYQDWRLSLVVVVVFPVAGLAARKLGRRARKSSTATQEETARLAALVSEAYTGARLVKAYRMEEYETARAIELIRRRFTHIMRMVRARAAASPATEALGGIAVGAAIFYGGLRAGQGAMTLGAFGSFITALLLAYQPAKSLANFNTVLQEGMAAAARLYALFDVEPKIANRPGAKPLVVDKAEIVFTDVGFSYGTDEAPALHYLSLRVEGAKRVALVGASGAGKSTILSLIPRFFDVASGAITIDGQDIRDITLASLRDAVALVTQDAILFDDTVRANISYGRPQAAFEDIVAAAKAAAAHDFITGLPQGYDTRLGEHGVRLSGGERQRIAIARAMLKNAPILLLDEATSQLDSESEQQVQIALGRLMRGRTTLVIAHRLATVVDADQIYVIDGGRVVEHGRHAELQALGGAYARLYATQFAARPAACEVPAETTERRASA